MITHTNVRGRGLHSLTLVALMTLAALVAAPSSIAQTRTAEAPAATTAPADGTGPEAEAPPVRAVVSSHRKVPRSRKVIRRHFSPWARPSKRQVMRIIRIESRRWGIDPRSLARRVACESGFRWWANGGAYFGLLQFAPSTFVRGVRTMRSRRVAIVRERWRRVREVRITRYSDGSVERDRGRARRQRIVTIVRGRIPRNPGLTHAWAQLRIGAQAIRGISGVRSSEWGCPA